MIFSFSLEYSIRKAQENQKGLELNGAHQLLVFADHINMMDKNLNAIKKTQKLC
jgi:hypothetical protein